MAGRERTGASRQEQAADVVAAFPTRILPAPQVREMPEEPRRYGRMIGPGALFGTLSAVTFRDQLTKLFGE